MTSPPEPPLPVIQTRGVPPQRQSLFATTTRRSAFAAGFSATFGVACALVVIFLGCWLAGVSLILVFAGAMKAFR